AQPGAARPPPAPAPVPARDHPPRRPRRGGALTGAGADRRSHEDPGRPERRLITDTSRRPALAAPPPAAATAARAARRPPRAAPAAAGTSLRAPVRTQPGRAAAPRRTASA